MVFHIDIYFLKILLRKACNDIIFTCDQLYMMCGLWRNFWTLYRVTKFKKLLKIRYFHFYGVSHRHLIFENSSQNGLQWYYFYFWPIIHGVWALKKFVKILSSDIILKIVKNKVFSLLWCFTQTSNFKKFFLERLPLILFLLVTNHTWCVGFEKICKDYIEWHDLKNCWK